MKAPKAYLVESGLAAHLVGTPRVAGKGALWGHLLEALEWAGRSLA